MTTHLRVQTAIIVDPFHNSSWLGHMTVVWSLLLHCERRHKTAKWQNHGRTIWDCIPTTYICPVYCRSAVETIQLHYHHTSSHPGGIEPTGNIVRLSAGNGRVSNMLISIATGAEQTRESTCALRWDGKHSRRGTTKCHMGLCFSTQQLHDWLECIAMFRGTQYCERRTAYTALVYWSLIGWTTDQWRQSLTG